jgi:hypothetical protein
MDLNNKLAALDQIYQIYDNFVSGLELACRKYCAHCCTTGVNLTTVEGYKIIKKLENDPTGTPHQNGAHSEFPARNSFLILFRNLKKRLIKLGPVFVTAKEKARQLINVLKQPSIRIDAGLVKGLEHGIG